MARFRRTRINTNDPLDAEAVAMNDDPFQIPGGGVPDGDAYWNAVYWQTIRNAREANAAFGIYAQAPKLDFVDCAFDLICGKIAVEHPMLHDLPHHRRSCEDGVAFSIQGPLYAEKAPDPFLRRRPYG